MPADEFFVQDGSGASYIMMQTLLEARLDFGVNRHLRPRKSARSLADHDRIGRRADLSFQGTNTLFVLFAVDKGRSGFLATYARGSLEAVSV